MTSKRPIILMGILLALIAVYMVQPLWSRSGGAAATALRKPLPGKNQISGLAIRRDADGKWFATFDYFYTGEPDWALPQIQLLRKDDTTGDSKTSTMPSSGMAQRGTHRASFEIQRPYIQSEAVTTTHVVARLIAANQQPIASQEVVQRIDWPDLQTWSFQRETAGKPAEELLAKAVGLIDVGEGRELAQAKRLLELLVTQNAQFDPAYVELARVAMQSNWGPEGLHQAERLLASALQIRPDNANAKILLGYVHAHQGRHREAEALFVDAAGSNPRNLWLWANWGELLTMQGKFGPAADKYREAITRARTNDTYDTARLDAYRNLIALLDRRKDLDGMEALYKQRAEEFGLTTCHGAEYARFMLLKRGNTSIAITVAKGAVDDQCGAPIAREVLGLAHYMVWANAQGSSRNDALHQARAFMAPGPRLIYLLASSEVTLPTVKQLLASGEAVDQRDNARFDALAYAMQGRDHAAARRLLRLGARATAMVGVDDMPVALLPVVSGDLDGIRLMQQFGVDYAAVRYRGMTAIDHAKQIGDRRLLNVLDHRASGA